MMTLALVSLLLAIIGMAVMLRGGVPDSVSGLVYNLSDTKQWWWSVWLSAVAITVMVPLMGCLGDLGCLGWLTSICLIGAAVTPIIKQDTRMMHNICGIAAGVLSQLCVLLLSPLWLLAWLILVPLVGGCFASLNDAEERPSLLHGKTVFEAEVTCSVTVYGSLLFSV